MNRIWRYFHLDRPYLPPTLALVAGALLPLAFAPFNYFPIAFISPAILLATWHHSRPLQAFFQGWIFGIGLLGIGISWVYISIHNFGNANVFLAFFITALFVTIFALFTAVQGLLFSILFRKKSPFIISFLAFPAVWVIGEWLRAKLLFNGLPWLLLGYSQIQSPLQGWGPLCGVYGISLLVTFISGCLYLISSHPKSSVKVLSVILITACLIAGHALSHLRWTRAYPHPLKVSLVQGNISQWEKWDSNNLESTILAYYSETKKQWESDIIIWPEAAIPLYPQQVAPLLDKLNQEAKQHHTTLITGIPFYAKKTDTVFNGLLILGEGDGFYLKRHLVPFGEYTPRFFDILMKQLNVPLSDLSPGPLDQPLLFAKDIPFAAFICYEIAYSSEVLRHIEKSRFIIVISDDSWFKKSIASAQQLQMAQMRALETGRYILYSTNTGITTIINPQGKIQQLVPTDQRVTLTDSIYPMTGKTPLMKWNYYPLAGLIIVFLLATLL